MNAKNVAVLLVVVCAVLVGGLFYQHNHDTDIIETLTQHNETLSNSWTTTSQQLDDTKQENVNLSKSLDASRAHSTTLSNHLATTSNELHQTKGELSHTESELKTAQDDLAKRDARINELTSENATLDQQADDLQTSIDRLKTAIADTEKKLESAEGDKAVLQAELKRLMAEKAELERQFNDLTALRTQVAKLKEELTVARRLDWIRRGLYGNMKGAQRMLRLSRGTLEPPQPETSTNYDLNVEVRADGSLEVIPPPPKTNQPASNQ